MEVKEGVIEAENKYCAVRKLQDLGLFAFFLEENVSLKEGAVISKYRIVFEDSLIFTQQLASLLECGLDILPALNLIKRQTKNFCLQFVIQDLMNGLRDGKTFSESLSKHGKVFSKLYVAMIKAAEASGQLDTVLKQLSDFLQQEIELKNRIRLSLAYPALVLMVGIITIYILMTFVIPKIIDIFKDFGQAKLPLATRILINVSKIFTNYSVFIFAGIFVLILALNKIAHTSKGIFILDKLKLRLPKIGTFLLKQEVSRFCRILSLLLTNGLPINLSLAVAGDTLRNNVLSSEIKEIEEKVKGGLSLSKAIEKSVYFPTFAANIISIGEESGGLEKSLEQICSMYDKDIEQSIKIFLSLLEPIIILIMGLLVSFIVVSLLLPILEINLIVH